MNDIQNIEDIQLFVNEFYGKIQEDDLLGPVFALKIEKDNWQIHLDKMYGFWNTILFHQVGYKGNPAASHFGLPVDKTHFDRWVELFKMTIDKNFKGPKAEDAKQRVDIMAAVFLAKIQFNQANPNYRPIV